MIHAFVDNKTPVYHYKGYMKNQLITFYLYFIEQYLMSYLRINVNTFKFVCKPVECCGSCVCVGPAVFKRYPITTLDMVRELRLLNDTI